MSQESDTIQPSLLAVSVNLDFHHTAKPVQNAQYPLLGNGHLLALTQLN